MDQAMASWTSSNGLSNTLGYDTDGRLTAIWVPGVQTLGFTYDNADRITQVANGIDTALTQNFGYDDQSRLLSVYASADNESFQYDANGNRLMQTGTVDTVSATSNRLASAGGTTYGYDAQGNTTTVNGAATYHYDAFHRMDSAGGMAYYVNPEGQRLRKSGAAGTSYFAPDRSGAMLAEYSSGGWIDYVWLNGRLIGRMAGGQVEAIHDDQLGRPEAVTDANRTVVWRAQNLAFTRNVTVASLTLNLGFPGQYYDAETGDWNNGFRDYSPGLGRYVESDPIGLSGGVNPYAYVGNSPISNIDPLGLCDKKKCTAARAFLASLGQQLSSAGSTVAWTGIGIVIGSGAAAFVAPEGAPAEYIGAETGAGLVGVGGTASSIGSTLTGYARGGVLGGTEALGASFLLGRINKFASGLGAVSGVTKSTGDAIEGLLEQASDGVLEVETQCHVN